MLTKVKQGVVGTVSQNGIGSIRQSSTLQKNELIRSYILRMTRYLSDPDSAYNGAKASIIRPGLQKDLIIGSRRSDDLFIDLIIGPGGYISHDKAYYYINVDNNRQNVGTHHNKYSNNTCIGCGEEGH
ncbi:hypothetical protein CONCODRAFT_8987 [Conidiobolus coronatus NRRL 28638]|uniref:Uncharacterized protein n=1 Tax=Conidiobolus coronatus (strain ATCC 28846 / CBS 209.66 / NRRL 28638) TaxID=796925 RepID=A0A137P1B0_CONC2|nr:hypothetical protein CONCODRAFT_8987 [Conidiobolus coronatus NRRL 28638]|eukprot:KXN68664.1 hypothetical protein CONCODRAFT_8987 [Conidiobolus coronatus NRRL 28638]